MARLSQEKGIDVLLQAAAVLAADGLEFELALIGDGPQRAALEKLAGELRLSTRVRFEGWRSGSEVHARILDSRALVLASFSEGLPIVIMEAFALQRPVIATAVGGIAELVVPGESGWLVPPGSVSELAGAMRMALTRPVEILGAMGRHGAARVSVAHDISIQARKIAHLLRDSSVQPTATRLAPAP